MLLMLLFILLLLMLLLLLRPSIFHAPEEPREEDATLRVLCPKAEPEADFELVD